MLFSSLNLFAHTKSRLRRITTAVISVFMLQMIAAGFCVSTASASHVSAEVKHAVEMNHCAEMNMNKDMAATQKDESSEHACAHCDLPDVSISLDKQTSVMDYVQSLYVFVALVPSASLLPVVDFQNFSPPLRTSLFIFDLNQRIRV